VHGFRSQLGKHVSGFFQRAGHGAARMLALAVPVFNCGEMLLRCFCRGLPCEPAPSGCTNGHIAITPCQARAGPGLKGDAAELVKFRDFVYIKESQPAYVQRR
jgi:hypothetical protein